MGPDTSVLKSCSATLHGELFVFGGNNGEVTHSTFSKFLIQATGKNKNTNATALHFINGCTQSIFTDIMVESDDGNNIYPMNVI